MTNGVSVYIGAASPMLTYSPWRSGPMGNAWSQLSSGGSVCQGSASYAVELSGVYSLNMAFLWQSSQAYSIRAGLDGTLNTCSGSSGTAGLTTTFGNHSARLETSCSSCASSNQFLFIGVEVVTQVVSSGTGVNATLDDASPNIQYSGFSSTTSVSISDKEIKAGSFFQDTISYTKTGGAKATFQFTGSALYLFGMTGPSFGVFQIAIDKQFMGTYNATTTYNTYDTLLFFTTHLSSSGSHTVTITNQLDGRLFALDYAVSVSSGSAETVGGGTPMTGRPVFTNTAVSPPGAPASGDNSGAVIGGVLGTLAGLTLLFFWYRYYRWQKAGGEGDYLVALCGRRKTPPAAKKEQEFKLWPMLKFQPRYAT